LRKIESFSAVEVSGLRDSGIVYKALVSGLRDNGFTVVQGGISDEDDLRNIGMKMNTDGVIFGYVTRIDQRSWVTDGEEHIRVRETSTGTRERVRYEPPKVITNKTAYVRLKALDGLNGYVIWDSEGFISDEAGVDTIYMIESITKKMLQDLPEPAPKAAVAAEPVSQPVAVGGKAPDFESETVGGDRITLSDYQNNKVVVLNFWGIRCLPCLQEMPKLEAIYKRYKDDGVEMLGVNVDGVGSDVIKKNLRKEIDGVELNVTYPLLLDEDFSIIDDYYLTVAPLTLIVDLDGTIRYMHTDYQPGDEIELDTAIKDVLNQG
jgi:peroxiredoxin